MIDVKEIQKKAKQEISEQATKVAVGNLKDLYEKLEKGRLVVRNVEREIESYLNQVAELTVYESAGVDVKPKR